MEAKDLTLEVVLKGRQQWVVPVYQRQYSWERDLVEALWLDLAELANRFEETGRVAQHFFGAIIYESAKAAGFGSMLRHMVVDGQQRLTTFHLMLAAVLDVAREREIQSIVDAVTPYVFNAKEAAMTDAERDTQKLWSALPDRPIFLRLASNGIAGLQEDYPRFFKSNGEVYLSDTEDRTVPKMIRAYAILRENLARFIDDGANEEEGVLSVPVENNFNAFLTGFLEAVTVVLIELGQEDDARAIFASLNGRSKPLSEFDLIRNDIFQRAIANGESEEEIYMGAWQELETAWWQTPVQQGRYTRARVDHFLTHMLVALSKTDIKVSEVANAYKARALLKGGKNVAREIDDMLAYAAVYRRLDEPSLGQPEARIGQFLEVWDMSVFHPIILQIGRSSLTADDKADLFKRLEDYILRRDIAGLTRKNFNKNVPSLLRAMEKNGQSVDSFNAWLDDASGDGSRMPTQSDIQAGCIELDAYSGLRPAKLRYIFHKIEHHLRTRHQECVTFDPNNLQVEHILPKRWAEHWPLPEGLQALNEDWSKHIEYGGAANQRQIAMFTKRERMKHSLGNLTLLTPAVNPEISNLAWSVKAGPKGFQKSILRLNTEFRDLDVWDEVKIERRGRELATTIAEIWPER